MAMNGIQSNVVKSVGIFPNNYAPTSKTSTNNCVSFADTLIKAQSQGMSTSPEMDTSQGISVEDAKYLDAVLLSDGTMVHYPPDNAPLAVKKAWIEAMKKMTDFQRAMTVADIIFPTEIDPNVGMTDEQIKARASGATSYQDIFKAFKQDMEKKLNGTNDVVGKGKCQEMIQAWDTLLTTFSKYNVK